MFVLILIILEYIYIKITTMNLAEKRVLILIILEYIYMFYVAKKKF